MSYKRVVTTRAVTLEDVQFTICNENRTCKSCPYADIRKERRACDADALRKNDPKTFLKLAGFEEVEDET